MISSAARSSRTRWQAARYVAVGCVVYAVDLSMFWLLLAASLNPPPANAVAKVTAAAVGFLLHRHFTFQLGATALRASEIGSYVSLLAANTAGTTLLLALLIEALGVPATPTKIAVDLLAIVVSFLASKFLVFGHNG